MARPKTYSKKLAKRLEDTEKRIAKVKYEQSQELYKEARWEFKNVKEKWMNLTDPQASKL